MGFTVKIDSLEEFDAVIGFWGGARDVWDNLTDEQKEIAEADVAEYDFESLTSVNDFVWFDLPDLFEEDDNNE